MAFQLSNERLSDLIGAIYDCVVEPDNWRATLDEVRTEFQLANAVLSVHALPTGSAGIVVATGITDEWLVRHAPYVNDAIDMWGGPERAMKYPLEEPIVQSRLDLYQKALESRYFLEWCKPQGFIDMVLIGLARDPAMVGSLGMGIHTSRDPITDAELSVLRLLAPHLRRAVTISGLLEMKRIEASTFTSVLDGFSMSVILVDDALAVVHANKAGEAMLSSGSPVSIRRGKLRTATDATTNALSAAIALCMQDVSALGRKGLGVPLKGSDGEILVAHVLPLQIDRIDIESRRQRAVAALFVTPATTPPPFPGAALAVLYDLTPAETRVTEMIAEGRTQAEISFELGIAPTTVKTHLQRVFDKTGAKRQSELVKLVASLSLPL